MLLMMPMLLMAQEYTESDTLWVNNALEAVDAQEATILGIVKNIDTEKNVATVHYYTREDSRLLSIQHVVAIGDGKGLRKGKQLFFDKEGKVTSMEVYTIVHDERKDKVTNRLASETYLYPDGKTREEVVITYGEGKNYMKRSYVRKCYYPDGQLQYEETMDDKEQTATYYNEKGKVTKRPKQKFERYLTMPEFPGGQEALFRFLSDNVKYPPIAQQNGIQGRVIVQFVVAKDGQIVDAHVVRTGGDPSLDKEALRVIKSMPRWIPGTQRGKPVRVQYTVPVNFRLH